MRATAYNPQTTAQLRTQWRSIVSRAIGRNAARAKTAAQFASFGGQQVGSGRWYAAALWRYNQY